MGSKLPLGALLWLLTVPTAGLAQPDGADRPEVADVAGAGTAGAQPAPEPAPEPTSATVPAATPEPLEGAAPPQASVAAEAAPSPQATDAATALVDPVPGPEAASAARAADADADAESEAAPSVEGAAPGDGREPVEEILVTGSRIKRSSFAAAAPVEIINREALEYSGASNLADVVQHLTVAQGSGWDGSMGSPNTTAVNLRGLGAGTTLVLLNGRRVAASGGGADIHFVDIGTIPLAAVERIEILKAGASAIYGSDAVAGVINIITRTDWNGVRAEADIAGSDDLDRGEANASIALGAASERARLSVALAYTRNGELIATDRDWTDRADRISNPGYPGSFFSRGALAVVPDPDCAKAPLSSLSASGDVCEFDERPFLALIGNLERGSVYAHAEYDITGHTQFFAEVGAARTRGDGIFTPSLPLPPPFPVVPADHVDNRFQRPLDFIGAPIGPEHGGKRNTADDDTMRAALGMRGDLQGAAANSFAEDWTWELFTTAGVSRYRGIIHDTLREELEQALASCSDPSDLSGCYNPFYSAELGTGTPNSDEVIATFDGALVSLTDQALQTHNAGIAGTLFELPGGDLGFAFGGELRQESRSTDFDHDANAQRYAFFLGNTDAAVTREVYGAYLELLWPFISGLELLTAGRVEKYTDTDTLAASPTLGLTLQPAELVGRERVVSPLRRLQLRGQVTRSFRAPTIYQSFPGNAVVPGLYNIPESPLPLFAPVQNFGNPELRPERALTLSAGLDWAPSDWLALTVDYFQYDYQDRISLENAEQILRADLAARESDGYVPDPRVVDGTECQGVIGPCIDRIIVRQLNQGDVFTNGIDMAVIVALSGATFGGSEDDFGKVSIGAQGTYTISYEIPSSAQAPLDDAGGRPLFDDAGDAILPADCDGKTCDVAGMRNSGNFAPALPRLRVNFPVTWSHSGHAASLLGHYISAFDDDAFGLDASGRLASLDAAFTLDVQYGYTLSDVVGDALTLRVGIRNLMDEDPPTVRPSGTALTGFVGEVHDPRGRMLYVNLVQEL